VPPQGSGGGGGGWRGGGGGGGGGGEGKTVAVQVVPNADEVFETMAPMFGLTPDQMRAAPLALIGTVSEIVETLRRRREELGFSYIVVHEAEFDALAPVVAELAGT
jgi:hypothetical protein